MIRVVINDKKIIMWKYNVRPDDIISSAKLRNKLKLHAMTECLHNRRLLWLDHLERKEENS